ncbi:putative fungal domain of unknown function (DUF1746) [Lyophyllum shimeji]|uniref:DUF1746 domain-containing protein n=1 Tax=Lyophyllum shimeji TaxID=47721 RepID=A0A9P3PJQ5_LYOSH|nr:putative fungal domain of unknown function (DUF1746) [Lyophyllum shimeji]
MPKQHHAQRQHIIASLDGLCYQLHTLSFILSPSIWSFICRLLSQFQCSRPRDFDATAARSLRFFFANILLLNLSSLWTHATHASAEGRAIVLDFVGLGYVPSRLQLLGLDFLIIFLQLVLTTIAYETSLLEHSPETDTHDTLLPIPNSALSPTPSPLFTPIPSTPIPNAMSRHTKSYPPNAASPYVVDLRFATIIARLRNPPPAPSTSSSDVSLPLPNTTPWPLPPSMRMLIRASAQMRREAGEGATTTTGGTRIPGGLTTRDG